MHLKLMFNWKNDNIHLAGGGGGGYIFLCLCTYLKFELLIIRSKTSCPEDFEFTKFYFTYSLYKYGP